MKKIKMWIELLFIFLLPLIFMSLSVKIETTKEYDENNNEISKESNFEWEYPYNDFKDTNHYKNYLYFNQLFELYDIAEENRFDYTINQNGSITFTNNTGEGLNLQKLLYIKPTTIKKNHKYFFNFDSQCNLRFWGTNSITFSVGYNGFTTYTANTMTDCEILYTIENVPNGGTFTIYPLLIDLTDMFGEGYEPTTRQELSNYIDLDYNYGLISNEEIIYYSESNNISENWEYNYSVWGTIYNDIIIKNLYLTDNVTTRFILTYTITWFIMFIIWHTIYVPFDWLIHLVTPKQKE